MNELESVEHKGRRENISDVGEGIGYTHKKITSEVRSRESLTEYTEDVSQGSFILINLSSILFNTMSNINAILILAF